MLCLPELLPACLAEFVEGAHANHGFEFFARGRDAVEEISH